MNSWQRYAAGIESRLTDQFVEKSSLAFWRNSLFITAITYIIPFGLIGLIPGIYWSLKTELPVLAIFDGLTVLGIAVAAFWPQMKLQLRKLIFIGSFYQVSIVLLYYLGLQGPGLIYLFVSSIFSLIIFNHKYAWHSAFFNTLVCVMFAVARMLDLTAWPDDHTNDVRVWLAISSNIVVVSFVASALAKALFVRLEKNIAESIALQRQVAEKQLEIERALDSLKKKNDELEQFASIASHDLQEPLRMVNSFMTQLDKKYAATLDDTAKKYIHFAVDGSHRMQKLIIDLLEYSRIGKASSPMEVIDVNDLIRKTILIFQEQIEELNAKVEVSPMPVITSKAGPVFQVFQNLISNALKYHSKERTPHIKLTCSESISYWEFCVSDNGIGILPEHFQRIFVIFQKLHPKSEYSGTGIGLAITKKIVEVLGGEIQVSSALNEGSSFCFKLPK